MYVKGIKNKKEDMHSSVILKKHAEQNLSIFALDHFEEIKLQIQSSHFSIFKKLIALQVVGVQEMPYG